MSGASGTAYGLLTVVRLNPGRKSQHPTADCVCQCGNKRRVRQTALRCGRIDRCARCAMKQAWENRSRTPVPLRAYARAFDTYKSNAKRRGLVFDLTKDECRSLFNSDCHYCGISPNRVVKVKGGQAGQVVNGIDRVDNLRGYEAGNVVACCDQCNFAKREMGADEFIQWALRVAAHQKGQK